MESRYIVKKYDDNWYKVIDNKYLVYFYTPNPRKINSYTLYVNNKLNKKQKIQEVRAYKIIRNDDCVYINKRSFGFNATFKVKTIGSIADRNSLLENYKNTKKIEKDPKFKHYYIYIGDKNAIRFIDRLKKGDKYIEITETKDTYMCGSNQIIYEVRYIKVEDKKKWMDKIYNKYSRMIADIRYKYGVK